MIRSIKSLIKRRLYATDGDIGSIDDIYFDHVSWRIRFIVLEAGSWFSGHDVLIPPEVVCIKYWTNNELPVTLSKDQVRNSPNANEHWPLYMQHENELFEYHPWKHYWQTVFSANGIWGIIFQSPAINGQKEDEISQDGKPADGNLHLRSAEQVMGYTIHAKDGEIGHVKDFMFDDETWKIIYLEVDTNNWFRGKRVLVAVKHVVDVLWDNSTVLLDVEMQFIKNGGDLPDDNVLKQLL